MANNTTLNSGTGGDVIATDDVAGVKYQRVKLMDGTEDSTAVIPGDATNGLDVDVTRVQGTVTVSGTVTANLGTANVTNAGTFAVQDSQVIADNAGFTDGTSKVFPVGLIFDEVAGTALTENDIAAPRLDSKRAAIGVIEDETTRGRRATVTASNALKVDNSGVTQPVSGTVTANLGTAAVTNAGTFAVQDSEKITDNAAFTDGTSKVMMAGYAFDETAGTALTENDAAAARVDSKRAQVLVIEDATTRGQRAAVSASNALKVDGSAATQPVSGTVTVNHGASASPAGLSKFHLASAASTNATNVKASAGKLHGWYIYNSNAAARKVAFHNTSGTPTAGSSVTDSLVVPPTSAANAFSDTGIAFSSGIGITTVTGLADSDATAVAANDLIINLYYI